MNLSTEPNLLLKREVAKKIVALYFRDDSDSPFILTDGQADIFNSIYLKEHRRNQIIAPTQYGKSETIAMALLVRSSMFHESWAIVTGQQSKSDIIMGKVIDHIFDNPYFISELELDSREPLDRIKRERSKRRITWKQGGDIATFTADAKNKKNVTRSLTGFGSPNLVEDEASLIDDDLQAMVMRMLGGHSGGHLIKIGNPFFRNHFKKTWDSDKYNHIFIDCNQAIREGRYTDEFLDEMRTLPFFSILYECKFPDEDEMDSSGYRRLLKENDIKFMDDVELGDNLRLGVDISAGGDDNVYVLRGDKGAKILSRNRSSDLMSQVNEVIRYIKEFELSHESVFIDDTGVGEGVTDRLHELGYYVTQVKVGEKAEDEEKFMNKKAENFWNMAVWLKKGGTLKRDDGFLQLFEIKYKIESGEKRLKIESKEELRKRGIHSPDVADALMLTHEPVYEPTVIIV